MAGPFNAYYYDITHAYSELLRKSLIDSCPITVARGGYRIFSAGCEVPESRIHSQHLHLVRDGIPVHPPDAAAGHDHRGHFPTHFGLDFRSEGLAKEPLLGR